MLYTTPTLKKLIIIIIIIIVIIITVGYIHNDTLVLLGFVQFLQYYYQSGVLYRLRALGVSYTMDTTVGQYLVTLLILHLLTLLPLTTFSTIFSLLQL